jgi:NitT/TauT family transport system substrate-binding protein
MLEKDAKMPTKSNTSHMKLLLIRTTIAVAALATAACLFACTRTDRKPAGPPEKVTIAYSATTDAVLAEVAHVKGYFLQEGLEVTPHLHPYGKLALEDLLAGKADFATVAETPVMFAIMKGEKISVIATIENSDMGNAILARRDRGITTPEDLRGKRIAATLGTTSEYYLDAMLGLHGISRKDVAVVDMKAGEMADALARGDIDAVSAFSPYTALTQKKLGNNVVPFQDKNIYRWAFNVVAKQDFIRKNPGKVKKVLHALVRAEEFVRENPPETQKIVADFSGIDIGIVRAIWADTSFDVTLDQSLILALEDESRWAIDGGQTGARKIPNYLDYIYFDGLKSVKPESVRILR